MQDMTMTAAAAPRATAGKNASGVPPLAAQGPDLEKLMRRFGMAQARRRDWEPLWQEAYEFSLPQRNSFDGSRPGARRMDRLYDATALDAVEQLAASLLGNLTPP